MIFRMFAVLPTYRRIQNRQAILPDPVYAQRSITNGRPESVTGDRCRIFTPPTWKRYCDNPTRTQYTTYYSKQKFIINTNNLFVYLYRFRDRSRVPRWGRVNITIIHEQYCVYTCVRVKYVTSRYLLNAYDSLLRFGPFDWSSAYRHPFPGLKSVSTLW